MANEITFDKLPQILWESPNFHLTKCYFYHFFANFALDKRS